MIANSVIANSLLVDYLRSSALEYMGQIDAFLAHGFKTPTKLRDCSLLPRRGLIPCLIAAYSWGEASLSSAIASSVKLSSRVCKPAKAKAILLGFICTKPQGLTKDTLATEIGLDAEIMDKAIAILIRHDVIKEENDNYRIIVELFRRWVMKVN